MPPFRTAHTAHIAHAAPALSDGVRQLPILEEGSGQSAERGWRLQHKAQPSSNHTQPCSHSSETPHHTLFQKHTTRHPGSRRCNGSCMCTPAPCAGTTQVSELRVCARAATGECARGVCGSSNQQKCVLLSCWTAYCCRRRPAAFQAGQAKGKEAGRDSHPAGWHTQRCLDTNMHALEMRSAVEGGKWGKRISKAPQRKQRTKPTNACKVCEARGLTGCLALP